MEDMGQYKVHFKNDKGEDETSGKVTVKPVSVRFKVKSVSEGIF